MISEDYFDLIDIKLKEIRSLEKENIKAAAKIVSESIMSGGILQSFGSGHSYAGAIEVAGRAGGLICSKVIEDPSKGQFEGIEGVGTLLMRKVDIRKEDVLIIVSNSGRNPLTIEIAENARARGAKIIAVTSLEVSKATKSRHSSGKRLFELADVILDNHSIDGDCALKIEGMEVAVGPTSSIVCAALLNGVILESYNDMISKDYVPPVYKSANIDGGREFNQELQKKYSDRIWRL